MTSRKALLWRLYWSVLTYAIACVEIKYSNNNNNNNSKKYLQTYRIILGLFATLKMTPDNAGEWALVCRTNDHYSAGMQAKYTVQKDCGKSSSMKSSEIVRRYYIAAVEVEWDYAPTGQDVLGGMPLEKSE